MAKELKHFTICLDGIDKTGKDLICAYVHYLGGKKYLINTRGWMSVVAYSNIYERNINYPMTGQENILNVLLTVNYDDWKIRCRLSDEPEIDYYLDSSAFMAAYETLSNAGYKTMLFNTSEHTPYEIAKMILKHIEDINNEVK